MQQLILVLHVLSALALISLVLVQHGKGADVGASFGSGAANTMFGSSGPASFLMKLTGILAAVFFATSIGLAYIGSKIASRNVQFYNKPVTTTQPQQQTTPTKSSTSQQLQDLPPVSSDGNDESVPTGPSSSNP